MSELLQLLASFIVGTLLGLAFFWGLWLTVDGLAQTRRPALRVLGSLLLRFGLVLATFYFLARHAGWQQVLAAAVGFMLVRLIIVQRMRSHHSKKESEA